MTPGPTAVLRSALLAPPDPVAPAAFADVRGLVTADCGRCRGEAVRKGGVNLAPFADAATVRRQRKLWRAVAEQVTTGRMPPEEAKQPTPAERDRLVRWVTDTLDAADRADRWPSATAAGGLRPRTARRGPTPRR